MDEADGEERPGSEGSTTGRHGLATVAERPANLVPMFSQILVPVDFTAKNEAALAVARELATTSGGNVTVLHVIERIDEEADEELDRFYERLEERARERMEPTLAALGDGGLTTSSRVVYGSRAHTIVETARDLACDLIVMSSHRVQSERPGADWISISHKVAILSPCPILLVK